MAVTKREAAWRELKTKITDYGANCGGFQTHDGRGTLEAALAAAEAYARVAYGRKEKGNG